MWDNCGKRAQEQNRVLTFECVLRIVANCLYATLLDRGAYRSLTTDTMCQNPFEPFRSSSWNG